jgi:hypothetical protein
MVIPEKKHLLPFLAFAIPLLVRFIPELLTGPYVVGFDTMAHYLPTTVLWINGNVDLWSFIGTAPLLYVITSGFVLAGSPVILALKVLPPLLMGFLGLALYGFASKSLGWSNKKSIVSAILGILYFVALRISWDALREELALVFLFVALMFFVSKNKTVKVSWMRYVGFCLAAVAVVLSNQVVTVLMFVIVIVSVLNQVYKKNLSEASHWVAFLLPAAALFLAVFFLTPSIPEYRVIFGLPSGNDGWIALFGYSSYPAMLASEASFLLYCFWPLIPLAFLSIRRFKNFQMQVWVISILAIALVPITSPSTMRLLMLIMYPLTLYVTEGLWRLKEIERKHSRLPTMRLGLIYLTAITLVLSLGFLALPAQTPLPYYAPPINGFIYQIPSSMLQNTVPITDCQNVANTITWLKENMTPNSVLLTHRAFYGWALAELNPNQVVLYEYDKPEQSAEKRTLEGKGQIYTIWWDNGQGWYGQPTIDASFHVVYESGDIAVFRYQTN